MKRTELTLADVDKLAPDERRALREHGAMAWKFLQRRVVGHGYGDLKNALGHVVLNCPTHVLEDLGALGVFVIFPQISSSFSARLVSLVEKGHPDNLPPMPPCRESKGPEEPPPLPEKSLPPARGVHVVVLGSVLLEVAFDLQVGVIAHELAHAILRHGYDDDADSEDEVQANQTAAAWGFEKEINLMRLNSAT